MSHTLVARRLLGTLLPLSLAAYAGGAAAIDFNVLGEEMKFENLFTVGAMWRMQSRDPSNIGKSSLNPGLCISRTAGGTPDGPDPNPNNNSFSGDGCATSVSASNQRFVDAPGSFSPNGDDGNLNFHKGDITQAVSKLTTDFSWSFVDYRLFARSLVFFDAQLYHFEEWHRDTTLENRHSSFTSDQQRYVGKRFELMEYNLSHVYSIAGHDLSAKVGNQVLNWGESSFLLSNSLNAINPPDLTKVRKPGFDLKELLQPQGMVVLGTDIIENLNLQSFYQYEWKPVIVDPVGTFFSVSDTLGAGGDYAMLSFAKQPEDPADLYRPNRNPNDPIGGLGSTAGRTIYRDHPEENRRQPKFGDPSGYGLALKWFAEGFNNGTEFGFYAANYTSRFPVVSAEASQGTCLNAEDGFMGLASVVAPPPTGCGVVPASQANPIATHSSPNDPVPVDTARLLVEYPRNIQLYGVSFNTTVGDFALSGEYAYRPNLPTQIQTVDLVFTALQPAFPDADIPIPGVGTIPGRQSAFPSFITKYRGLPCGQGQACIQPGQYIQGYERLKTGQLNLTLLRLVGGDNPLGASQMTFLFETGMNHVINFPHINQLQFAGGNTDVHISGGADGTSGIDPCGTNPDCTVPGNSRANTLRQNPTAADDRKGFGTQYSAGYRLINLSRWDDALFGANLETLAGFFHDVYGTTPGIGGNFVEGRKQALLGLRFDYLSRWIGEVRYTWYFGQSRDRDPLRDRDNIFVTAGYLF